MSLPFTFTQVLTVKPVLSNFGSGPYAAGSNLGGLLTLPMITRQPQTATIVSVLLLDKDKQAKAIDVVFFAQNPTNTTFTDNAPVAVDPGDLLNCIGHVSVQAADYSQFSANAVATKANIQLPFKLLTSGELSLYAALVARGNPTFGGTDRLALTVGVRQDGGG